ncbi:IS481 family transposase, partial [Thiorhodococcus minor]|nr:IS481 family transposase [Thiorhodococcus minor]
TVSLAGIRLEIPARYRALETVHLRYARWDLAHVDLVDPHSGVILAPLHPLDKAANAGEPRRALTPAAPATQPSPPSGMAPLLRALIAEHAATGLPPAFLPLDSPENNP